MGSISKKHKNRTGRTIDNSKGKKKVQNPHLKNYEKYAPTEMTPKNGFYHDWGHQAMINWLIGSAAIKRLYPLVPQTLVPLLIQHSGNREDVEAAFKKIKELHEEPMPFDSPYEKFRKIYGNYVREIEWSCNELRKYLPQQDYEDLVIGSTVGHINKVLGKYIDKMKEMMVQGGAKESLSKPPDKREEFKNTIMTKVANFQFKYVFNAAGWMVGDVEIKEFNFRTTELLMKVTDCLMLRAPRMRQLPVQACLLA